MNPLAREIWIYIILAYGLVSITMWIVARFSPIEWRITRPPMCDNYFADRMRRKRAKCDCKYDKGQNNQMHDDDNRDDDDDDDDDGNDNDNGDECNHTNQDVDECGNCNIEDNIDTTNAFDDGGGDMDRNVEENGDGGVDAVGSGEDADDEDIKYKLNKRFRSTKDMGRFLIGEDVRQPHSTDDAHLNDDNDSFDCNDTAMILAHDCNHDCCGVHTEHMPVNCIDTKSRRMCTNDIDGMNDGSHQLRSNHNIHEHHNSVDSYVDTHICDFIDCDGFQETQLLCSENDFTLTNSFWFSIGTLMQQGSDLNPKVSSFY